VNDGFSKRIEISKSGMLKSDRKVRIGSELKQMEKEYQEERNEIKHKTQKREKGINY